MTQRSSSALSNFVLLPHERQLDLFEDFGPDESVVQRYAECIAAQGFLPVYSVVHLSRLVGYDQSLLYTIANASRKFYREFSIPKSSGGERVIHEPLPALKAIQRTLLDTVFRKVRLSRAARAYRRGYTLRGVALLHQQQSIIVSLDIERFFTSLRVDQVYGALYRAGYTKEVSSLIASICTRDGVLPQGSPTSGVISNFLLKEFDEEILLWAKSGGYRYSRYADDIVISSADKTMDVSSVIRELSRRLRNMDLHLNRKKTRVMRDGSRKSVHSVVVNERPNLSLKERRSLRQEMYYIKQFGVDGHIRMSGIRKPRYLDHLIGRFAYAYQITQESHYLDGHRFLLSLRN